ncbi:MAG: hypothetical protein WCI87_06430 [Euryarchaeota archaeon]
MSENERYFTIKKLMLLTVLVSRSENCETWPAEIGRKSMYQASKLPAVVEEDTGPFHKPGILLKKPKPVTFWVLFSVCFCLQLFATGNIPKQRNRYIEQTTFLFIEITLNGFNSPKVV